MINLPITLEHISMLLTNDAKRKQDDMTVLTPVVRLVIDGSAISVILASINEELSELYGLFHMPNAEPKLATMKVQDFIRLSEHMKKPIYVDEDWEACETLDECYQEAIHHFEAQTIH